MVQVTRRQMQHLFRNLRLKEPDEQYLRAAQEKYFLKGKGVFGGEYIEKKEWDAHIQELEANAKDSIDPRELEKYKKEGKKFFGDNS